MHCLAAATASLLDRITWTALQRQQLHSWTTSRSPAAGGVAIRLGELVCQPGASVRKRLPSRLGVRQLVVTAKEDLGPEATVSFRAQAALPHKQGPSLHLLREEGLDAWLPLASAEVGECGSLLGCTVKPHMLNTVWGLRVGIVSAAWGRQSLLCSSGLRLTRHAATLPVLRQGVLMRQTLNPRPSNVQWTGHAVAACWTGHWAEA